MHATSSAGTTPTIRPENRPGGPGRPVVIEGLPSRGNDDMFSLNEPIIIAIDGPAGTGKSSVARELARRLGLDFLDTGAMYRAAAAVALDRGIALDEVEELIRAVHEADIRFDWSQDPPLILACGRAMNVRIREQDVTAVVSAYAGVKALRELMVAQQQAIARDHKRLVTEGRDQGSVVFPNARVKFYLDASPRVRADRRLSQLKDSGVEADLSNLQREIEARDLSDKSRAVGPLTCPSDAEVVDTSNMTFEQVVNSLYEIVMAKSVAV
ncbi:MAG TPA: (d)CMP kinase [Phycisphaerales bacterium]|nr:(d)CMP kinase [Phycisphaerales bacterium]